MRSIHCGNWEVKKRLCSVYVAAFMQRLCRFFRDNIGWCGEGGVKEEVLGDTSPVPRKYSSEKDFTNNLLARDRFAQIFMLNFLDV